MIMVVVTVCTLTSKYSEYFKATILATKLCTHWEIEFAYKVPESLLYHSCSYIGTPGSTTLAAGTSLGREGPNPCPIPTRLSEVEPCCYHVESSQGGSDRDVDSDSDVLSIRPSPVSYSPGQAFLSFRISAQVAFMRG